MLGAKSVCQSLRRFAKSDLALLLALGQICMKNPLTFRVESWVGSVIVLVFSAFLVGTFVLAVQNFGSEAEILTSSNNGVKLRIVSAQEKVLIDGWLAKANTSISAEDVGYRHLIKKYPDKPWAER